MPGLTMQEAVVAWRAEAGAPRPRGLAQVILAGAVAGAADGSDDVDDQGGGRGSDSGGCGFGHRRKSQSFWSRWVHVLAVWLTVRVARTGSAIEDVHGFAGRCASVGSGPAKPPPPFPVYNRLTDFHQLARSWAERWHCRHRASGRARRVHTTSHVNDGGRCAPRRDCVPRGRGISGQHLVGCGRALGCFAATGRELAAVSRSALPCEARCTAVWG